MPKLIALMTSAWLALLCNAGAVETAPPPYQVLISVKDQRLAVVCDGELVSRYPVSTSRYGTGDQFGSYKTPLGSLKVCDKIGEDLSPGAVIHHRAATGEVLPVNAPGRDPIVTRIIWLDGLEPQNKNAHSRGIYIHGTPEERNIGTPSSYGCIRMRSKDVIKVFDQIPVGTVVSIIPDKLPHMHHWAPPKEQPAPSPENDRPPGPAAASLPSPTESKAPAETAKPAPEQAKPGIGPVATPAPLPAVGESPDHETGFAWKAMKGSFLMANVPLFTADLSSKKRHGDAAVQLQP